MLDRGTSAALPYTRAAMVTAAAYVAAARMPIPQLGLPEAAIADYTAALEVEPRNSYALYNRGITRDRMGDYAGAVEDFSGAIALDPCNADFYHNRGFSLRKQARSHASSIVQSFMLEAALANPRWPLTVSGCPD
jgi:tetratricopeptide (TPR) repeat protein